MLMETSPKGCVHGEDLLGALDAFIQDHTVPAAVPDTQGPGWTLLPSCPQLQNQQRLMSPFRPKAGELKSPRGAEDTQKTY